MVLAWGSVGLDLVMKMSRLCVRVCIRILVELVHGAASTMVEDVHYATR